MAAKNPRVMVVLEQPLYRWLRRTARAGGVSVSLRLRDLVRDAFELHEDRYWAREGERRLRSFRRRQSLTHEQVWGR